MVSNPITRPRFLHTSLVNFNFLPMLDFCCLTYVSSLLVGVACWRCSGEPRCKHPDAALHDAERTKPLHDPRLAEGERQAALIPVR